MAALGKGGDASSDKKDDKKEFVNNAFKSSRVINGHSMEFIGKGVMDVRILHRFGYVNTGFQNLFGLDQASMRMGFDYGLSKDLTIGIGRSKCNLSNVYSCLRKLMDTPNGMVSNSSPHEFLIRYCFLGSSNPTNQHPHLTIT
jgi:hypothetical protein